jgi:regulatory protein
MDGDDRYSAARAQAVRLLAVRDLSEAELRERLDSLGFATAELDAILPELRRVGYLDDLRVALSVILSGVGAGRGAARIDRQLLERGVRRADIDRAWDEARADHALDEAKLLERGLARRLTREMIPLDRRAFRRVYNAMLRAGFDADEVASALEPHLESEPPTGEAD